MEKVKYIILGAGPAGLTFANKLKDRGEDSFLVLEKERQAGGLCRSVMVDGSPFDIGGGHFLDVRRPKVNDYLFRFMPKEEWELFQRDSRIWVDGTEVGHPLEANIWQFELKEQVEYLSSIAKAGCNSGIPAPERFVDWITWKLGRRIADHYMLPYNRKMFADELNELGTYWLEKLPNVSFEETLISCLTHKPYGTQPGHAEFYYPRKYGYGELWRRMAKEIEKNIFYGTEVKEIDCGKRSVTAASGEKFEAEYIITTIPWCCFKQIQGMPEEIQCSLAELKYSSIETRYVPERLNTVAQWIYVPDPSVPYHRILVRHNFCMGSNGYWVETRKDRENGKEIEGGQYHYFNEFAYPLNTVEKPCVMKRLLDYCVKKNIYGLGRWGEHCHYNSDLVVEKAMELSDQLK